ncbi:MAG: hypothetical protein QNJ84_05120 [Alphaproteobacteria bacterium]|nr:hypothetical protein [Alphaproteobacteria bacterium]
MLIFVVCMVRIGAELGAPLPAPSDGKDEPYALCMHVSVFYLLHQGFFALMNGAIVLWIIWLRSLSTVMLATAAAWIMLDVFFMTHQGSLLFARDLSSSPFLGPFCRALWERWG